ncbi:hypothetical protein [Cupriavidus pauculus]|uniref:hypothetical protein n=1 Tax=Cupriavidus pauculus TaxID=82633 RepID=UPI003857A29C
MEIRVEPEEWTEAHDAEVNGAFAGKAKTDTGGGLTDPAACARRGVFCRVYREGEPVAWYVLHGVQHAYGAEAEIVFAHGRADFDLVSEVLPLIEHQCRAFDAVTIVTRRRGLIKKLRAAGYGMDAVILRKRVKHGDPAA